MHFAYSHSVRLLMYLILVAGLASCGQSTAREGRPAEHTPTPMPPKAQANEDQDDSSMTVNVVISDFKYSLDPTTAHAGTIRFVVANTGSTPHDFAITVAGHQYKTSLLQSGARESLTVNLQPGTYDYICSVPGHDMLGMRGVFVVT
jgi:plastocyanin